MQLKYDNEKTLSLNPLSIIIGCSLICNNILKLRPARMKGIEL